MGVTAAQPRAALRSTACIEAAAGLVPSPCPAPTAHIAASAAAAAARAAAHPASCVQRVTCNKRTASESWPPSSPSSAAAAGAACARHDGKRTCVQAQPDGWPSHRSSTGSHAPLQLRETQRHDRARPRPAAEKTAPLTAARRSALASRDGSISAPRARAR
jgi:hypothetical protein